MSYKDKRKKYNLFQKRIIKIWGGGPTIKDGHTHKLNILCLIRDFPIFGWFYLGWPIIENAMDSEVSARTTTFGHLLVVNNNRYKKYCLTLKCKRKSNSQESHIWHIWLWQNTFFTCYQGHKTYLMPPWPNVWYLAW